VRAPLLGAGGTVTLVVGAAVGIALVVSSFALGPTGPSENDYGYLGCQPEPRPQSVLPPTGSSTLVACGGWVNWSFAVSSASTVSGSATINAAAPLTVYLFDDLNWSLFLNNSGHWHNASRWDEQGGPVSFSFQFGPGNWILVILNPEIVGPPGPACPSCGPSPPTQLYWTQGIEIQTSGSVTIR